VAECRVYQARAEVAPAAKQMASASRSAAFAIVGHA